MLEQLTLQDVGPFRSLRLDLAPRLNLITGDNGLGKTLLLDVLWWLATGTWAGEAQAFPWRPIGDRVPITPKLGGRLSGQPRDGAWDRQAQRWSTPPVETSELVLYFRLDGSYAVWDPHQEEAVTVLSATELWEGKTAPSSGPERARIVCRGLLEDWVSWQARLTPEATALEGALAALSEEGEKLRVGTPARVRRDDRRDIPTLMLSYGEVPVTLASAGVKRVLGMAYLLVWAWSEHLRAAELTQQAPASGMLVLLDEAELHLHPRWQRALLPSLLTAIKVISLLLQTPAPRLQLVVTTHAPAVLTSVEQLFDEAEDELILIERDGAVVHTRSLPFEKEGDVTGWLDSDVFGRVGGRSREAALATRAAQHLMAGREVEAEQSLSGLGRPSAGPLIERIHRALCDTLPGHDPLWAQWALCYRGADAAR